MQQRSVLPGRLGKYCFIPIGLLLLLAAVSTAWTTKAWLARAVEVRGQVIEMVRVRAKESHRYLFTPLVRFQTVDGRVVEFQSSHRSNPPAYYTGQAVSVLYDPEQPNSAAICGVLSIWSLPMVLSFLGAIFLALGTVIAVLIERELAQPEVDAKLVGG
jgi:hypothetical protein